MSETRPVMKENVPAWAKRPTFPKGISSILEAEWDILIILDACRLDYFERVNQIPGWLYAFTPNSTCTLDYCRQHFAPFKNYEANYVSGNPYVNTQKPLYGFWAPDTFTNIIDAWDFGWNPVTQTVHPAIITELGSQYVEDTKRLILHYIQPHIPYIGEIKFSTKTISGHRDFVKGLTDESITTFWARDLDEDILQRMQQGYLDNLRLVLRSVMLFLRYLPKNRRVIITADHGELLGEPDPETGKPRMGHPCMEYDVLELNTVPWLFVDMSRIERVPLPPGYGITKPRRGSHSLRERMRALGYV